MGIISIIYLIVIAISCISGAFAAIKLRNKSIEQFKKNSEQRKKKFENGNY